MATCHEVPRMVARVPDRKRESSLHDEPAEKRSRICASMSPSQLHLEIAHIMHITRRRSHELTKLLCTSQPSDRRSIRYQLDPSIFDAEVSDEDSDEVHQEKVHLLPEEREEIQCLLEPRCLDAAYDEDAELADTGSDDDNDDSDELPDIEDDCQDGSDVENESNSLDRDLERPSWTSAGGNLRKSSVDIVPVLDKLKLLPIVRLTRLEDLRPHIKKKLKLTHNSMPHKAPTPAPSHMLKAAPQRKFVWNEEHHSRLKSIVCSVGRHLSTLKPPSTCNAVTVRKTLKIPNEQVCSEKVISAVKPWCYDSDSSDSSSKNSEVTGRHKKDVQHGKNHSWKRCRNSQLLNGHPLHAVHTLSSNGKMVASLSQCIAHVLDSCDREDTEFQLRFLRLCHSCLAKRVSWPLALLRQLFHLVLKGSCSSVQFGAYDALSILLTLGKPIQLPFNWQTVCTISNRILHTREEITGQLARRTLGLVLALQYVISALEQDVAQRQSVQQSHVACWFSNEHRYQCASQIAEWLLSSVTLDQLGGMSGVLKQLKTSDFALPTCTQVSWILMLFQRLLNLFIIVTGTVGFHMERLITLLCQGYIRLPTYAHRHLLVSNVTSSILLFKLCRRILKDYTCGGSEMLCASATCTITDLLHACSTYKPLRGLASKEDEEEQKRDEDIQKKDKYSPASVEELAFITWSLIKARIKMNKNGQHVAKPKDLNVCVQQLEAWYKSLTSQLSVKTQLYLKMMESLSTA